MIGLGYVPINLPNRDTGTKPKIPRVKFNYKNTLYVLNYTLKIFLYKKFCNILFYLVQVQLKVDINESLSLAEANTEVNASPVTINYYTISFKFVKMLIVVYA
jgi:hypothetical protein